MSNNTSIEARKLWPWWGHLALSGSWITALYGLSSKQTAIDLLWFTATLTMTMVPIIALLAHQGAVRRTMLLAALKPSSTFAGLLRGTHLRTFVAACLAVMISVLLVLQMVLPGTRDPLFWLLAGQAVLVVVALPLALSWMRQHFQPWSQVHVVQQLVVFAAAGAAAFAAVLLLPLQDHVSLEQALETTPFPNAPLIDLLALSQTAIDGLQRMALSETAAMGARPRFAANFIYFVLWLPPFLASAAMFVALGVRWSEMRRAFSAPQTSDLPAPAAVGALIAAVLAFGSLWGLHQQLFVPLNQFLGDKQVVPQIRAKIDVVRFGERYFRAQAVQQVLATRPDLSALRLKARDTMCKEADRAFALARQGAVDYVDHYYTMPAVTMRIGLAFADDPADHMKREIQSRVFGTDFQKLLSFGAATVKQTEVMAAEVDRQWRAQVEPILAQHEVFPSDDVELNVVYEAPDLGTLLAAPGKIMDPQWQGATVAASALLAKGGMEAVAGRTSQRIANAPAIQSLLSRISKATGLKGSAKASVETIAKTFTRGATAVLGTVVGTVGGVIVSKGMLEADEAMHRKNFEKQMLGEIEKARTEFIKGAGCPV